MNDTSKTILKKQGMFAVIFLIADLFFMATAFSQTVVVNPTSPWTVPAGVTSIKVEVWGAGGGGGTGGGAGGGGGGGAYNVATFPVTPGHTFTITVGTGGSSGNAGGATSVTGVDGSVSANGGGAGGNASFDFGSFSWINGGAGSAATGNHNGGAGGASSGNGAGGGGGAGNNGDGTNGSNTSNGTGGAGNPNNSTYIGGNGGAFRNTNGTGNNGITPGGGGGGGRGSSGFPSFTPFAGGTGGNGQVVITYSACGTITASATSTNVLCNGTSTGQIIVSGNGGATPYTFSINNGASYQPSNTFNNLPTGTYKIRVKDNNGCESKAVQ
jgi:hypothetical protein